MNDQDKNLFFDLDKFNVITKKSINCYVSKIYFAWFVTSETGTFIINLLDGKNSIDRIVEKFAENYSISVEQAEKDVLSFCDQLNIRGLINPQTAYTYNKLINVYIDITNICDQKCIYCNKDLSVCFDKGINMTKEAFIRILDSMSPNFEQDSTVIHLTGGEPFLNPYLVDFVHEIKKRGCRSVIWTNGKYVKEELVTEIGHIVDHFNVALDSIEPEMNNQLRGEEAYHYAIKAMDLFYRKECNFYIDVTPTKYNVGIIDTLVDFAFDNHAKGIIINQPILKHENGSSLQDFFSEDIEEYIISEKKALRKESILKNWKNKKLGGTVLFTVYPSRFSCVNSAHKLINKNHCGAGVNELSVDVNGEVYPCHMLQVRGESIDPLDFEHSPIANTCNECDSWMFCLGGCLAHNKYETDANKDKMCKYMHSFYNSILLGE